MSATSVCRFFKKYTHQNLWNYLNGFRIVRAAQMIVETDDPIAEIGMRCGFYNISNFNRAFRERIGSPPGDYRRKFGSTVISPDAKQVEEIGRKLDEMRCGQDSAGGAGGQSPCQRLTNPFSGTIDVFLDTQSPALQTEKATSACTAPQKLDTFGVFFMKYNYEIRLKAVKLVLEGGLSVREAGCHLGCGRSQVHLWVTLFERHGLAGLKLRHGSYSAEFKLSVLKHMHQNHLSLLETAVHFGIPGPFVIRQWERLYQNQGAEGLRRKPQRRRPAMSKSKTKKVKLKTTPHEELLKELEYLRAENAYLKKLQALVEERIVRESGKEPKPSKD